MIRVAKAGCRLGKRIEHGLQIECRPADDLENVGGGGLLLERFAQLVEQASVLYGDDRLVGKVVSSSTCLSVNGRIERRARLNTPIGVFSRNSGAPIMVR